MEERVLHVDSDQDYAEKLFFNLLTIRISAHHICSVKEALADIIDQNYDVVICEMDLQLITGAQFIRALKGLNPRLTVIVISKWGESHRMEDAFAAGASEYLVKGLNDHKVMAFINSLRSSGIDKL